MSAIHWKVGYEVELLAPQGASRKDLALRLAERAGGGTVAPVFVPQAELVHTDSIQVFENLTLGYDAFDASGSLIARCADDMTLQADLDRSAPPKPGWYRIVGDDARILRLIKRHSDPNASLDTVLLPSAALFGVDLQQFDNGMVRLADGHASIAMATHLPGERERPCEIITPPISSDHHERLAALLGPAADMGFTIPAEAALHVHFDAAPLCSTASFARLVLIFDRFGDQLKALLGTNPHCTRLGKWPAELMDLIETPEFASLSWDDARLQLGQLKLTKYVDFNIINMVHATDKKHTFEVRILPVEFDVGNVIRSTALLEGLLHAALDPGIDARKIKTSTLGQLVERLPLEPETKQHWLGKIASQPMPTLSS
ncbi:amidoligase family protein [Hoeflea sp. G2-23]|uniref:Amidoligase family protein n=1 Tax=Hoeflea algicola TaxID=2983763 RepID=A0ABT3Z5K6_9HYPH|nr:amidoligase family protein [Hoeflea algicola]MCY0147060.1 amidoligase family protein [Hoeflea algicola]